MTKKEQSRIVYTDITKIKIWLKKNNIQKYTINHDLTVNVQDKYIHIESTSYLPVNFGTVNGDMNLSSCDLKSLAGSPKHVKGNFICKENEITSLIGCPEIIEGNFDISYNLLTSIENGPLKIGKGYFCNNNQLSSLIGCPKEILGSFHCHRNLITNLNGGPNDVIMSYFCDNNPYLTSLEGLHLTIGKTFNCDNTPINSLHNCSISFNDYFCHTNSYGKIKELIDFYNEEGKLSMTRQEFNYVFLNKNLNNKTRPEKRNKL